MRSSTQWELPAVVFLTGAAVLIIEITALRVLAPFFGSTIFTTSSVITVILLALSLGYAFGGQLATRFPNIRHFYLTILCGGISVVAMAFLAHWFLPMVGYALSLQYGPFFMSLVLFFLPAFLLGILSPFAIHLMHLDAQASDVGPIAGRIFFYSTLGSITGSLATTFWLIPFVGLQNIFVFTGLGLTLLGGMPLIRRHEFSAPLWLLLITGLAGSGALMNQHHLSALPNLLHEEDGLYQKIMFYDTVFQGTPARVLLLDRQYSAGVSLPDHKPLFEYNQYYRLHQLLSQPAEHILVLGGGGYVLPQAFREALPGAFVDVVEIEPRLLALSQEYFSIPEDDPLMQNYVADARQFLQATDQQYDVIFCDAYNTLDSVPIHLSTQEFFQALRSKLKPGGMLIANFIGRIDRDPQYNYLAAVYKTIDTVFSHPVLFATEGRVYGRNQNYILMATNDNIDWKSALASLPSNRDGWTQSLWNRIVTPEHVLPMQQVALLTDDYAPIEYYAAKTQWDNAKEVAPWHGI